jgi:hypothetical protein
MDAMGSLGPCLFPLNPKEFDRSTQHAPPRPPPPSTKHQQSHTHKALGSEFDGPYDLRVGDGVEGRSDVYTAVTEAIGLKRRVRSFFWCWGGVCVCVGVGVGGGGGGRKRSSGRKWWC